MSHLLTLSWNDEQFYLTHREDAITLGQSKPGSDGNEGVFYISQSSSITGASSQNCLVNIQDTHWGILPLCRDAVGEFYSSSWQGHLVEGHTQNTHYF